MALIPEVVNPLPQEKPKKSRVQERFKIRHLPPEVRRELDRRLATDDYVGFRELSSWLEEEHQQRISPSALHTYFRNNFDPLLRAVKMAAMQSAEIVRVTSGDDDLITRALFRLVQTAIFDLLIQLNKTHQLMGRVPGSVHHGKAVLETRAAKQAAAGAGEQAGSATPKPLESKFSTSVEVAAVSALGKVASIVSKAMVDVERWREQMREKLSAQLAVTTTRVTEAARAGGMSAETEATIRAMLMEIKV
jgi:hypothetical protein